MKPNFTHLTFNSNSGCSVSTSSVPSTCCSGWQGRCAAPAALGVAFRGRRVFSAALGPAGSPKTPRSSAGQGARRLYLCTGLRELLRKSKKIKSKKWQKNWVSNIPKCNLKYSLGNAAVFCKSAKCHRFVFLQVLPFCSIIYDGKHWNCFDSLFWFLLAELAQISSDPLSWLGEPPHRSLHRWIFQRNTVTISAVSLTLSHTSLSTPLHLGAYSQVCAAQVSLWLHSVTWKTCLL